MSFKLSIRLCFDCPSHPLLIHLYSLPRSCSSSFLMKCLTLSVPLQVQPSFRTVLSCMSPTFIVPVILISYPSSCNTTHSSLKHPQFCHIQLLLLRFLRCPCLNPVHHRRSCNIFPLTLKLIFLSYSTTDTDTLFQFHHPDCTVRVIS